MVKPPVSECFRLCISEIFESHQLFGISSLTDIESNLFGIFFNMKLLRFWAGVFSGKMCNAWSGYLGSSFCMNHDFKLSSQLWSILPALIWLIKSIISVSSFWHLTRSNYTNLKLNQRPTLPNISIILASSHLTRGLASTGSSTEKYQVSSKRDVLLGTKYFVWSVLYFIR